jgi:AcrR family transcriptional regulator
MPDFPGSPAPRHDFELPVLDQFPVERADAARNRKVILDAARRLVAVGDSFSVEEVAHAAGVGVGTIYRRFGDRAGLAYAVVGLFEFEFQKQFIYGPPPLGPGAPPAERIRAFLQAMVDKVEAQRGLLVSAEISSATARYETGAYSAHRVHLAFLIGLLRPHADAGYLADALLAPFSATLIAYQRTHRGLSATEIKSGVNDLLELLGFEIQPR